MKTQTTKRQNDGLVPKRSEPPSLGRVLANPTRALILSELYLHPMSPTQFQREVGGDKSTIGRAFRKLAEWGCIELIEQKGGGSLRGGVEKIYRAVQRDDLRQADWEELTQAEREEKSGNSITIFFRRVSEAVEAKTFDADASRHFSWDAITLDAIAWDQLSRHLDEILDSLPDLEAEAAQRLRESDEPGISSTIGLALFRSPTKAQRRLSSPEKVTRS